MMVPRQVQPVQTTTAQPSRSRKQSDNPRNARILRWGMPALLAGVLMTASFTEAPAHLPLSPCAFYNVTGLPCPACGLTRGFVALGHGHLAASLAWHPLAPVLYVATFGALVVSVLAAVRGGPWRFERRTTQYAAAIATVAVMAVWVWRLAHGPLPGPPPLVAHVWQHVISNGL